MTNPTPEQLMQWKEAGVLIEVADSAPYNPSLVAGGFPHSWYGPIQICDDALDVYEHIRPYREPGHVQPHDGSAERPKHVKANDLVIVSRRTLTDWWSDVDAGLADWSDVHFYIVLPEIKP